MIHNAFNRPIRGSKSFPFLVTSSLHFTEQLSFSSPTFQENLANPSGPSDQHHIRWKMGLMGCRGTPIWDVDLEVLVVVMLIGVVFLNLVEESKQLSTSHPMRGVVDKVNEDGGPYIGLVMAYPTEELALQLSGFFLPNPDIPWIQLAGRRFNIGKINGVKVIYVMTGEQTTNAALTVQALLDAFNIQGIVHYGTAGSTNDSLSLGDVSVMNYVAFTSSWKWKEFKSEKGQLPTLTFGAFNFPEKGENLLAKIEFRPVQLYSTGKQMEELFWLPIDSNWFNIAAQLQNLTLQQCVNDTCCLPEKPKVVHGLKGSTADIFLDNAAYREYLFKQFNVSTVDEESAAVVFTCLTNAVPCIVFRGVSDLASGNGSPLSASLSSLASVNALTVAVQFIHLVNGESSVVDQ
ncbi:LOW QUALITY PROTEIN: bark storage protein A-like [Durio zibethinus]|uniref:LOW QUALITY PROTEIN: bark storage protein A-like n=1 Tax=Durio zibethinus TaxID=66656 RepID=A0A6P5WVM5_DURZI|nr:LOW QUALITY PROTEIN: bark storage protein A-like [Durio zibethinus]